MKEIEYCKPKKEEQVLVLQHNIQNGKKISHYAGIKQNKL
jgi:hypothetical protein